MVDLADKNPTTGAGDLRVTLEAEIIVRLNQHLCIDGTVRVVTNRATFAQCFVFKDKGPRLITMTLSAGLIESRNAKPARWFHDVSAMGIVTLHTVHFSFDDRVMLRHGKLRVCFEVALEAGGGVFARIQNELPSTTTHLDVFASRAVTGFTSTLSGSCIGSELHSGVRAGRKDPDVVGMTLKTCLVADEISAWNGGAHHDGSGSCRTRVCHAQHKKP